MSEPNTLEEQVKSFAVDVVTRIRACLEGESDAHDVEVDASPDGSRFTFKYSQPLRAEGRGAPVGHLKLHYALGVDRSGEYLAVLESSFKLHDKRGNTPIVRIEYVRDPRHVPCSHIHVHAQSGNLTQLLAACGHNSPAAVESVHIPTGGDRFRPCVEDFVEFLVTECGIAANKGWRDQVIEGREEWRKKQTAAAVRDRPEEAIRVLESLGLQVNGTLPEGRPSARSRY
ncbi:MAG: hypothetical protein QM658_14590 [Gordonia sp. (in: high G+C Gram-positive bacteria)]